jgi:F0F1-type ATP synthase membrane subunit b/b'
MISFDLEIFIIQMVIFILFLLFTSRFIVRPVLEMADRRQKLLADGRGTAEKAEIKATDYLGMYQFDISSSHKEGAEMIKTARKKASDERFDFIQAEKLRTAAYIAENRMKIRSAGEDLRKGLKDNEDALVSMVCEKLWGGK